MGPLLSIHLLYPCVALFPSPNPTPPPREQRRSSAASFRGPQPRAHSGCVAAGSSALGHGRPRWVSCRGKQRDVRCGAQRHSLGCARVFRHPPRVEWATLPSSQPVCPAFLPPANKGSEEGGRRLARPACWRLRWCPFTAVAQVFV